MAYNARKTEHAGAKRGRGAYYGRKVAAKNDSRRQRREDDKRAAAELETAGKRARHTR